ncbi:MAG: thioredoxin domain-containing protein, partial [Gammaproteobacteria bacterium]|nr:thioredoxin domain-containing protein [Gammaproteobacteria bacterium]
SLDADSEGEEGKYYVWTPADVLALLDPEEYRVFAPRFGLDRAANFDGAWHLHVHKETSELEQATGLKAGEIRQLLLSARNKLLAEREKRVRPGRDEKILTSWNALMIKGMATAGRLMERSDWIDSADHALRYLMKHHWHNGRLLATSRDGAARLNAYLDDYAYLIDAILAMLQARWCSEYLQFACELAECLIAHFEDPEHGGFFFTSVDHEALVYRPKPLTDDAMPSGNGVAVEALQTLAQLVGDPRLQAVADRALRSAWPAIEGAPYAHIGLLEGLQNYLEPPEQLIIRGVAPELEAWQKLACSAYVPGKSVFPIRLGEQQLPLGLAEKRGQEGQTLAYRCRGSLCEPPIASSDLL